MYSIDLKTGKKAIKNLVPKTIIDKVKGLVDKAVSLIGRELFTAMHQGLQNLDYGTLKRIAKSSVEDLPQIMKEINIERDMIDFAYSLKKVSDPDSKQRKYRLMKTMLNDDTVKREIYHSKIVTLCQDFLKKKVGENDDDENVIINEPTAKAASTSTMAVSSCSTSKKQQASTLEEAPDVLKGASSNLESSINNINDSLDNDILEEESDCSPKESVDKDDIEEVTTVTISNEIIIKMVDVQKVKDTILKDLPKGKTRNTVKKMFNYISSVVNAVDII